MLSASVFVHAQTVHKTEHGIVTHIQGQRIELTFYDDAIVRITKTENREYELSPVPVVTMLPQKVSLNISEKDDVAEIATPAVTAVINKHSGAVTVCDASGRDLISEKAFGGQFLPANYDGTASHLVKQAWRLHEDEQVFGLGQQQTGQFSQRNRRFRLQQENMIICMPYFYSTRGYGLLWNNASPTVWSDSRNETSFESDMGSAVDYYVIAGGNADKVLAGLRRLTGHAPMNALWTYGYWQSRERYTNQEEIVDVVRRYRDIKVPLDVIVQDWQYWGHTDPQWNGITWTKEEYPEPERMMREIHSLNAHCIASLWPSFGNGTEVYRDFKSRGYMLGIKTYPEENVDVYDVFNPEARKLYWDYLSRKMFSTGLDGYWLDATEPEMKEMGKAYNADTYLGKLRKNANAFPLYCVEDVYKNQRLQTDSKRVTILTRSAYLGQQRIGSISWSGDIDARWDVMARQIPAALNFSLCGNPYWNTDLGGFWVRDYDGCTDPRYRELYVRWVQWGVFMSIMRSHGTNTPREIWQFGERGSWAFDAIEKAIRMRYALVPYIYSTAWQVSHNDDTFMRPLLMDFADDPTAVGMSTEYMFGRSLLVAPVTEPMYVDDERNYHPTTDARKMVYLPKGCDWYDYATSERHAGGTVVNRTVAIDEIPVYVRAGSIMPVGPDVQYTAERRWDNLPVTIYPGADGDFTLYEDEGDGYNYEQGKCAEIPMHWNDATRTLTIGVRQGSFKGMLKSRTFIVNVAGTTKHTKVKYNGKAATIRF